MLFLPLCRVTICPWVGFARTCLGFFEGFLSRLGKSGELNKFKTVAVSLNNRSCKFKAVAVKAGQLQSQMYISYLTVDPRLVAACYVKRPV